ncbi:MAG: putative damage-inducible protein DinB [Neolewinella sp.]|jgi:uncharacterized damage-inducible protein DinB
MNALRGLTTLRVVRKGIEHMKITLLASYQKQFAYYRHLGEKAMAQLSDEELFRDDAAGSNSVAVIVKHLSGNMKSRWTDFLTTDGEKPWRNRDQEFIAGFSNRAELETAWAEGWAVLEVAVNGLQPEQLSTIVYIRNEGHMVAEALNRQLAHYAHHVGQIVLLGKQHRGTDWQPLSIPKGDSAKYNAGKFAEEKGVRNFIDGLMK